jgi:hypothetical protein
LVSFWLSGAQQPKSHGEVFLVEQDTIEYVSVAYLKFPRNFLNFFHLHFMCF